MGLPIRTLLAVFLCSGVIWAQEPVLRVIDLKTVGATPVHLEHRKPRDKQWYPAFVGTMGAVKDHFKTSPETVAALEFFIGGRVGVSKDTEIEVVTERSVASTGDSLQKIILVNGGLWIKCNPLKKPLEIQTNGGTMAIRGTEFTLESNPDSTTLGVLDGKVEVRDTQQKLLGLATPGTVYHLQQDKPPEVVQYDPEELRRQSEQGDLGQAIAMVKADLQGITASMPGLYDKLRDLQEEVAKLTLAPPYQAAILKEPVEVGGVQGMQPRGRIAAASVFQWKPYAGADGYVIFVSDDDSFANMVFSERTRDTTAVYPAQARPLDPGLYYWRVIPVDAQDEPYPEGVTQSTFTVFPHR